jgi:tetratricopeptide (TPR) repeat protein
VRTEARAARQGQGLQASHRMAAILYNGLGRYETARAEAQKAAEELPELFSSMWALVELIEAASRSGQVGLAADALVRLAEATSIGQTDWGRGIYVRCRAVLSDGAEAEGWYREAIDRLSGTQLRTELARAHLLHGEWLHRVDRLSDAREELRTAHDMCESIGMEAFAERARRELLAAGETVRKRTVETRDQLTPRRPRSRGWPGRACPIRRSAPSCSCPPGRSNGT